MGDYSDIDSQHYCNYPEVSKKTRSIYSVSEDISLSASTSHKPSISDLSILVATVSNTSIQSTAFCQRKYSPSLINFLQDSASSHDAFSYIAKESTSEDSSEDISSYEDSVLVEEDKLQKENVPYLSGWIQFAFDPDPWNEANYTCDCFSEFCNEGILSRQIVSKCTSKLVQLPDSKHFVFSRLHLNNKGLEDISVLCGYRYFQYIDLSWNYISDINALNNCKYLMYLNVAHNKMSSVLEFPPPWFLTHVNLSCNEISKIGENLSNFWSLRHIDLSYNNIEKINGLRNLKYLRYLNLSHNHITKIDSLDCINVEELYLQYNQISNDGIEDSGLNNFTNIKTINISRNKISQLQIFKGLYTLKELDISDNCINNLVELEHFIGFGNLITLNLAGNCLCSTEGYRKLIIYTIPTLRLLDSVTVSSSEKVAARMLFDPDILTRTHHTRAKLELWNQLSGQIVNMSDTAPCDQFPNPLMILVGTFDNGKENLAKTLVSQLPDQIYRFKKYTTMSSTTLSYDDENLICVSVDDFNVMIKSGKFLSYYKETGFFFGISRDELCKCIIESKIGLIDTNLDAALVLKLLGLRPVLILCVVEDIPNYKEILRNDFMKMDFSYNLFSESSEEWNSVDNSEADPCEGVSFDWTWSLASSVTAESLPDENYLLTLKQRERFVTRTVEEQSQYIELNNAHPSLFMATVCTDNIGSSVKTIEETCFDILVNRDQQLSFKQLSDDVCATFIGKRIDYLMKNLLNISS